MTFCSFDWIPSSATSSRQESCYEIIRRPLFWSVNISLFCSFLADMFFLSEPKRRETGVSVRLIHTCGCVFDIKVDNCSIPSSRHTQQAGPGLCRALNHEETLQGDTWWLILVCDEWEESTSSRISLKQPQFPAWLLNLAPRQQGTGINFILAMWQKLTFFFSVQARVNWSWILITARDKKSHFFFQNSKEPTLT